MFDKPFFEIKKSIYFVIYKSLNISIGIVDPSSLPFGGMPGQEKQLVGLLGNENIEIKMIRK